MKRFYKTILLLLIITCSVPFVQLQAHDITDQEVQNVGISVELKICQDKLTMDYWIHIGDLAALPYRKIIDKNEDTKISTEEKEEFITALKKTF